jgi:hypothetical protein
MAKLNKLIDDFTASALNTLKWGTFTSGAGASVTPSSGVLTCTVPVSLISEAQLNTVKKNFELTGSYIKGKVTVAAGTTVDTAFKLADVTAVNALYFVLGPTSIIARKTLSSVDTDLQTGTYNSSTMAWLRIRESGGTTYFETSPDGEAWTTFTSIANVAGVPYDSLQFIFTAVEWAADAAAGAATIDNINTGQSFINPKNMLRPRPFAPGRAR